MKKLLNKVICFVTVLVAFTSCKKENTELAPEANDINSFSELLESIGEADSADQYSLVEGFIDSLNFPFIENDTTAYFLYYGDAASVSIAGDFTSWNPSGKSFT